jgi:hypothetical protein
MSYYVYELPCSNHNRARDLDEACLLWFGQAAGSVAMYLNGLEHGLERFDGASFACSVCNTID